jgi:hypothetical protein
MGTRIIAFLCIISLFMIASGAAARDAAVETQEKDPEDPARVIVLDGSNVHDVGELLMHVGNWGIFGSFPSTTLPFSFAPSAEWPAGSGVEHLCISGLWVGAKKNGIPAVSTSAYQFEFRPTDDPIDIIYHSYEGDEGGSRWPYPDADDDGDGLVDEDWLDGHDNDGDGLIDEDFAAIGDQMFSCWFTDDQPIASELYPEHEPLHLLVRQESYQWDDWRFDDFVGIRFVITNMGTDILEDVYLGFFADFDIGSRDQASYWADDAISSYFGLRSTEYGAAPLRMVYGYDTDLDGVLTTSYIGAMMLGHTVDPLGVEAPNETKITSLQVFKDGLPYENGGDPTNDFERYDALAKNSVDRSAYGADFRALIGTGPFTSIEPGETIEINIALVAGDGFRGLIDNAAYAQVFFDGTWFDIDGDPSTGVDGKETLVHWYLESAFAIPAVLDIRPCSCPNPFNVALFDFLDDGNENKGGVLPVAILGTEDFDVSKVDLSMVWLEGVAPLPERGGYKDVSGPPAGAAACECPIEGPDGYGDLMLKFSSLEIAEALLAKEGPAEAGEVRELTMTGRLLDGTIFEASDCITFVGRKQEKRPDSHAPSLLAASPNPFNPTTRISYYLPDGGRVRLAVYDVSGRLVDVLEEGVRPAGEHAVEWSAQGIASGVYFYRLEAGDVTVTRKVVLLR